MQRTKRIGIATFVSKLRSSSSPSSPRTGLGAHLLRWKTRFDRWKMWACSSGSAQAAHVQAYRKATEKLSKDELDPALLRDESTEQVRALIDKKVSQHRDVIEHESVTGEAPEARIIDLMEVLKQSLTKDAKKAKRA